MTVRKYKILNDAECQQLNHHFSVRTQQWCEDWVPSIDRELTLANACLSKDQRDAFSAEHCRHYYSGDERVWACLSVKQSLFENLIKTIFSRSDEKLSANADKDLIENYTERALECLIGNLFRGTIAAKITEEDPSTASVDAWAAGSGASLMALKLGRASPMLILISPAMVDSLLKESNQNVSFDLPNLAARSSSIGKERLSLEVCVGSTELEFGQIQELAEGDVITLDASINNPLLIQTTDGKPVCVGYPGIKEGKLSIQIESKAS